MQKKGLQGLAFGFAKYEKEKSHPDLIEMALKEFSKNQCFQSY